MRAVVMIAFLAVDFTYYWWHRLSHRVNFLWAAHVVHHQSEDYNLAVALRQAVATVWTILPFHLPLALLGVPPAVFITVDPERDTPAALKDYVTAFDAPILALSGTPDQVAQAAKGFRVYYAKHPEAGGDYSMDHSSVIYVMDPQGRFTASFTHESTPEQITERLKKLIG